MEDTKNIDPTPQLTSESFFLEAMESNAYSGRYFCQEEETDSRRCLFCRQKGHLIRDCPKKVLSKTLMDRRSIVHCVNNCMIPSNVLHRSSVLDALD